MIVFFKVLLHFFCFNILLSYSFSSHCCDDIDTSQNNISKAFNTQQEITNRINRVRPSPYGSPRECEREFLELILMNCFAIENGISGLPLEEETARLERLNYLLEAANNPLLHYNDTSFEENFALFPINKNTSNIDQIKEAYFSVQKMHTKKEIA